LILKSTIQFYSKIPRYINDTHPKLYSHIFMLLLACQWLQMYVDSGSLFKTAFGNTAELATSHTKIWMRSGGLPNKSIHLEIAEEL
jgi:hypothetical protein